MHSFFHAYVCQNFNSLEVFLKDKLVCKCFDGNRFLPDIWCVSRDVELCSWIKVLLGTLGARADSLILCPLQKTDA